jgi:1,4-dihydroxy-6-naphthoate synthase
MCQELTEDVKNSIIHALDNPTEALEFAKLWGRGSDDETNRSFVKIYVNERTIDFGDDGRAAVRLFLSEGKKIGMVDPNFDIEGIEFIGCDE